MWPRWAHLEPEAASLTRQSVRDISCNTGLGRSSASRIIHQPPEENDLQSIWLPISIFDHAGKTMHWIEKWLTPSRIVTTFSISMQSLEEIKLRAGCRSENSCFCMSGLVCLRVGNIVQTVIVRRFWGRLRCHFQRFFRRDCSVRCTTWFSFTSPGGARIFAKLPSKITKSPKIGGKVCAHPFV